MTPASRSMRCHCPCAVAMRRLVSKMMRRRWGEPSCTIRLCPVSGSTMRWRPHQPLRRRIGSSSLRKSWRVRPLAMTLSISARISLRISSLATLATMKEATCWPATRGLAVWTGLVLKAASSGGKRPGPISKQGSHYLRWLVISGAMAVVRRGQKTGSAGRPWLSSLVENRPLKVAAMALTNRIAPIAWALLSRGERYRDPVLRTAWRPAPHSLGRSNDVMPERVKPGIG